MTPTYEEVRRWMTPERLARFQAKIKIAEGDCHVWTGALSDSGHGQYRMLGAIVRVHRITWIMERSRDIPSDIVIRHLMCDHKACCNPAHLVGGSQGENVQDEVFVHRAYDRAKEAEARRRYLANPYIGYLHDGDVAPACTVVGCRCRKDVTDTSKRDEEQSVSLSPTLYYDLETTSLQRHSNLATMSQTTL